MTSKLYFTGDNGESVDITNYVDADSLSFTADGATIGGQAPEGSDLAAALSNYTTEFSFDSEGGVDFKWLAQALSALLTPQEELKFRIQSAVDGTDPGEPVNTRYWKVWS